MKIIFFHHAGGDQYAFLPYKDHLEKMGWEAVYYELPGHGDRYNEPLLYHIDAVMEDVWNKIGQELEGEYVLFGNSMGSLIAYLLLHRIVQEQVESPRYFFAASRMCPASYPVVIRKTDMTHEEFWEMIREYGGAADFIDNPEFRSMFEPILRADFSILESYIHLPKPVLHVPATLMFGANDRYSDSEQKTWDAHFTKIDLHLVNAGHFFAYEDPSKILEIMCSSLFGTGN